MHRSALTTELRDEDVFQNVVLRTYGDEDSFEWSVIAVVDEMGFLAIDKGEADEYRVKIDTSRHKQSTIGTEGEAREAIDRYMDWI